MQPEIRQNGSNHLKTKKAIGTNRAVTFFLLLSFVWLYNAYAASIIYTYDSMGQLIKADYGNGKSIIYTYDAAGNKLTKKVAGGLTTLIVAKSGTGGGTITSSSGGISCGDICSASYSKTAQVTLTATPDEGSFFAAWSGDCMGPDTCIVTMDASRNVTAIFSADTTTPQTYTLTVTKSSTGGGTVTSSPSGISCGETCSASFARSTEVTLTASPDVGFVLDHWSGDCTGTGTCTVTMSAARNVTATFKPVTYPSVPGGTYSANQSITITSGEGATIYYSTDESTPTRVYTGPIAISRTTTLKYYAVDNAGHAESVQTAAYTINWRLTIQTMGTGSGIVTSQPSGIKCDTTCTKSYTSGNPFSVILTASPDNSSTFVQWMGACSGTSPTCTLTVDDSKTVMAAFKLEVPPYVSFSGAVRDLSLMNPIPNAVIQAVDNSSISTTTDASGNFALSGIPSETYFSIKISKDGFLDTYSGNLYLMRDKAALWPYVLHEVHETDAWPFYQSTKGTIISRVVNRANPSQTISGAVVDCNPSIGTCQVTYSNNTSFGGTSTSANGIYIVSGLDESAQVTVTAAKDGWNFSPAYFIAQANGVSEELIFGETNVPSIPLSPGWNFISLPKEPLYAAIAEILKDISANVRVVWTYDNVNKTWLKYKPSPGSSPNTLFTIEPDKGYWFYVNDEIALDMTNWTPLSTTMVPLSEGWNLIGYKGTNSKNILQGLGGGIDGKWVVLWTWENGQWYARHATINSLPVQLLTTLYQGKAYWIKTNTAQSVDWTQ